MIAICSNTSVYVGVTIFALVLPVGVLVGFEAARFLSATEMYSEYSFQVVTVPDIPISGLSGS